MLSHRTEIPELPHWRVITDAEIEQMRAAVLHILDSSGFRFCSQEILERLERRGLRVDYATQTARATPAQMAMVEDNARLRAMSSIAEASHQPTMKATAGALLRRPLPGPENVGHN